MVTLVTKVTMVIVVKVSGRNLSGDNLDRRGNVTILTVVTIVVVVTIVTTLKPLQYTFTKKIFSHGS